MKSTHWHNKHVAILGYGVEGKSSATYFLRHGASVTVHDAKPVSDLGSQVEADQARGARFVCGDDAFQDLSGFDLVMRTPSFPVYHPALQSLPRQKVSSQTQLFLERWRDQTVGISGTKGKGTVASLMHHLLLAAGKKVVLAGNIGVSLLDVIDDMSEEHIAVLELSSYQLWDVAISPHIAILLMIAPEHLELHQSLDGYLAAKQNLLRYQRDTDQAIILSDYHLTRHLANLMPADQWKISNGWVEKGAKITGLRAEVRTNQTFEFSIDQTKLRGEHNTANAAAAVVAASLLGVSERVVLSSLPDYQPLSHRLELVAESEGIAFYDDSIATTPPATIAALKSFTEPMVVILGGINKQADWSDVSDAIKESGKVKGCVLVGEESPRILQALKEFDLDVPVLVSPATLDKAIQWSVNQLKEFDRGIILLSPGAKSFDQYQDYVQRGQKFQQAVTSYIQNKPS